MYAILLMASSVLNINRVNWLVSVGVQARLEREA